jgi:aminoglycoside 2'-N-acetyltransferase I
MTDLRVVHTADLDAATLETVRALLQEVFGEQLDDHDWEHALGGMHVLAREDGALIGHAAVVQRRLLHGGRALRSGYLEGVAVRRELHGRGVGAALMDAAERVVRDAFALGALGSSDEALGFYAARGWQLWRGPTSALTPTGVRRTPEEDGGIYVLPVDVELDLDGELTCDWREGDVW